MALCIKEEDYIRLKQKTKGKVKEVMHQIIDEEIKLASKRVVKKLMDEFDLNEIEEALLVSRKDDWETAWERLSKDDERR